jgi:hypothetical protein
VVTATDPIITTPAPENTPALQTITTVMVRTAVPQPGVERPPNQQQANQEEQQARARARQIDVEQWATQCHDELTDEQAALDAQMTELHRRKLQWGHSELPPSTSPKPELGSEPSPPPSTMKLCRVQPLPGPAKMWKSSWILCPHPLRTGSARCTDSWRTSSIWPLNSSEEFAPSASRCFRLNPRKFQGHPIENRNRAPHSGNHVFTSVSPIPSVTEPLEWTH